MSAPGFEQLVSRAHAALDVGRLDEAERAARGALAVDPAAEEVHALLARVHLARGAPAEALRAAEVGVGVAPRSEWLHRLRAVALSDLGRHEEALAAADEAVRLEPELAPAHHVRSCVLEAMKDLPEARAAAERAVALDPENGLYRAQLGDVWLVEDPARAERHYRESLAIDPERAMTLNNLGVALSRLELKREAALAFRSAVILDPTLEIAKENARTSVQALAGGGSLLFVAVLLTQLARALGEGLRGQTGDGSDWRVIAAVLGFLVALWGGFLWRRAAGMRRLAREEPQLHAIYAKLAADRRGRLRTTLRRVLDGLRSASVGDLVKAARRRS